MRLINSKTFQLKEINDSRQVRYAALSHRWTDDEVLFEDISNFRDCMKRGTEKVRRFCHHAEKNGLNWVWIDTCCINKYSSAELSEAINSMYTWYQDAHVCYAYLADVDVSVVKANPSFILQSVWFTRSWTLQELLAPKVVIFLDRSWNFIGTKESLKHEISRGTYIDVEALEGRDLSNFSISQRMCWASTRSATRVEDIAYSLLGLFDISMPLLYGEGTRAFLRLQEEIAKHSADETIFSWDSDLGGSIASGILASSPSLFRTCSGMRAGHQPRKTGFSITNRGLSIEFDLIPLSYDTFVALLNCVYTKAYEPDQLVGIYLRQVSDSQFDRVRWGSGGCRWIGARSDIFSSQTIRMENAYISSRVSSREPRTDMVRFPNKGLLLQDTPAYRSLMAISRVSYRGSWNVDKGMIEVPINHQGALITFYLAATYVIELLQFGFDQDFNPVCLILERTKETSKSTNEGDLHDTLKDIFDYQKIGWIVPQAKDGRVVSLKRSRPGFWPIKGDREQGLHCNLSYMVVKGVDRCIRLKMNKVKDVMDESIDDKTSEIWNLEMIALDREALFHHKGM
ncbi:hypothetical protein H2198_006535 [Neophaeococcomyces mojaviensis]|uniref:Uncharacterized protein n=1 Tax=Neophaeococcomyces mojaviensis TaxID=3383035 RepID=A0ACC3A2N6_9EURO|nr:hypothetical protein H2198_006535 [Knufia sp. JES_112]